MRVICQTLNEFIENLKNEPSVFQDVVRYSRIFRPVGEESLRNALKVEVIFQASAVIDVGNDGQYLLEVGMDCGNDYKDGEEPVLDGTKAASMLKNKLDEYCKSRGLKVRPGIIDM